MGAVVRSKRGLRSYVRNWFEGSQGLLPNDVWTQTFITGH